MAKNNISDLARPTIRQLKPYLSARLITEQQNLNDEIYLDANENPYLPYPQDASTRYFNRYPEQQPKKIKKLLSTIYGINSNNLLITRGSGEAIDLLIRTFCEPKKDSIIICPPTFGLYEVYAQINDIKICSIPLLQNRQFQLDITAIIKEAQAKSVKLIFIPSPNAPMGHLMKQQDILDLCKNLSDKTIIVIDEAYIEFSAKKSMARFLKRLPNLVILRTLSKGYAMAGLRIGSCIATPKLIILLSTVLAPYPLCVASTMAATKALQPRGLKLANKNIKRLINEREKLIEKLKKTPCVCKVYSSSANFVLFQTKDADDVINYCAEKGIIVRSQTTQIANCVRVSIGTATENKKFLKILEKYSVGIRSLNKSNR